MKRALVTLGVLGCAFAIVIGPWPVSNPDLESTSWYKASLQSVERSLSDSFTSGPLQAGIAALAIDLPKGLPLAGYGARMGAASTGAHDPIRAKAAAFSVGGRTAVLVGADILLINELLVEEVSRRLAPGLKREQLYFVATHTHSGPGGWGRFWAENMIAGAPSKEGVAAIADGMARAAESALANLEPATLSYGKALAPEFIRNRLIGGDAPVDPSLHVVRMTGRDGKCLGSLVSFAAHSTVLGADNLLFSAEYPGELERALERRWGGTAFFCVGPVGSMSPRGEGKGFERTQFVGEGLANHAERLLAEGGLKPLTGEVTFQAECLPIAAPPLQYRLTNNLRLSPIFSGWLLKFNRGAPINVLRIGSLLMVGMPCELSGEIALELYPYAEQHGLHLILTPFNGSYQGYVVPDKYFSLNEYETRAMRFLGPDAGAYYEAVIRMVIEKEAGCPLTEGV